MSQMFVFTFGDGGYDTQHAVVLADSLDEARGLLVADIEAQTAAAPRWPHDPETINPNWMGREGFLPSYHAADRIGQAADAGFPPRAVEGSIVYLIGVDG